MSLANEPSLYSTRLTVLGKVIRQVDSENPHYVDVETQHAFEQAVDQHPALVERLDLTPTLLERQFSAAVSVNAPGAVVLPIAIFK